MFETHIRQPKQHQLEGIAKNLENHSRTIRKYLFYLILEKLIFKTLTSVRY